MRKNILIISASQTQLNRKACLRDTRQKADQIHSFRREPPKDYRSKVHVCQTTKSLRRYSNRISETKDFRSSLATLADLRCSEGIRTASCTHCSIVDAWHKLNASTILLPHIRTCFNTNCAYSDTIRCYQPYCAKCTHIALMLHLYLKPKTKSRKLKLTLLTRA